MVVVDRVSKVAHFMALSHPYTAMQIAQVFMDTMYRLHGLPKVILSDGDVVFMSKFWKGLFAVLKVWLHTSTAYHPQSDEQTEVVNKCLECYLRSEPFASLDRRLVKKGNGALVYVMVH
ncbi:retrotransposable element Tf2 [Tanacetum coccineum]